MIGLELDVVRYSFFEEVEEKEEAHEVIWKARAVLLDASNLFVSLNVVDSLFCKGWLQWWSKVCSTSQKHDIDSETMVMCVVWCFKRLK